MDKPQRKNMRRFGKGKKAEEFGGRKVDDSHLLMGCKLDMHRGIREAEEKFRVIFRCSSLQRI